MFVPRGRSERMLLSETPRAALSPCDTMVLSNYKCWDTRYGDRTHAHLPTHTPCVCPRCVSSSAHMRTRFDPSAGATKHPTRRNPPDHLRATCTRPPAWYLARSGDCIHTFDRFGDRESGVASTTHTPNLSNSFVMQWGLPQPLPLRATRVAPALEAHETKTAT